MIKPDELISKFQYALDNNWGYIWGTAGVKWTAAKQADLEKTTDSDRANSREYGSKWIGHMVADCSGLFSWAFKQLGGYMYHGSDTMWNKYCTAKGKLKDGKRTDGKPLLPGTAVFTYSSETGKRGHVGLHIGGGYVIEARGAYYGVVKTKLTSRPWVEWGELNGVDYSGDAPEPKPDPGPEKGYAEVTGKRVALREEPSTRAAIITRIDTGKTVKLEPDPPKEWDYVSFNGKTGWMMRKFLKEG
jgi:uncharacterized protein YgiM (DUF1202 family)